MIQEIATTKEQTKSINWDSFKCRCSAITKLMTNGRGSEPLTDKQSLLLKELEAKDNRTEKQSLEMARLLEKQKKSKEVVLGESAIEYLMEYYAYKTEGIIPLDKELSSIPQLEKGKIVEADSIVLLSRVDKMVYEKNAEQVHNDYFTGEPDVFSGPSIYEAEIIIDMKNCWDYPGFLKSWHKPIEPAYNDQVNGYCDITGAPLGYIVRTIMTMPPTEMEKIKWKLLNMMGGGTTESEEFQAIWQTLYRSMDVERIPIHKRVFKRPVEPWTNERKQAIYDRVKFCREWLHKFDEMYQKLK
jgi:hypothetical protein